MFGEPKNFSTYPLCKIDKELFFFLFSFPVKIKCNTHTHTPATWAKYSGSNLVRHSLQMCQEKEGTEDPANAFEGGGGKSFGPCHQKNHLHTPGSVPFGRCFASHYPPLSSCRAFWNLEAKIASLTKRFWDEVAQLHR